MSSSVSQTQIYFDQIELYLNALPPVSTETADAWSSAEVEQMKIGDMLFVLTVNHSAGSNPSSGAGCAPGDTFTVSAAMLVFRQDAGYPMCFCVQSDSYDMQFAETLLSSRAEAAKDKKIGFYYVLARPKQPPTQEQLAELQAMHKWGNNGSRKQPPRGLSDPMYMFLVNMGIQVERFFGHQPMNLHDLGFNILTGNPAALGSKLPNCRAFFEPIRARKSLSQVSGARSAPAVQSSGGGLGLDALLDLSRPAPNLNDLLDLSQPAPPVPPMPAAPPPAPVVPPPAPQAATSTAGGSLDSLLDLSKPAPPAPSAPSLDSLLDLSTPAPSPAKPSLDSLLDLSSPVPPPAAKPSLDSLLDLGQPVPPAPPAASPSLDSLLDLNQPAPPSPPAAKPSLDSLLDLNQPAPPAPPTAKQSLDSLLDLNQPAPSTPPMPPPPVAQSSALDALLDNSKSSHNGEKSFSSASALDALLDRPAQGAGVTTPPHTPPEPGSGSSALDSLLEMSGSQPPPSLDSLLDVSRSAPPPPVPMKRTNQVADAKESKIPLGTSKQETPAEPNKALDSLFSANSLFGDSPAPAAQTPPAPQTSLDSFASQLESLAQPSTPAPPAGDQSGLSLFDKPPSSAAEPVKDTPSLFDKPAASNPPAATESLFDAPAPPPAPPVQETPAAPSLFDTPASPPAPPPAPPVQETPAAPSLFDTPAPPVQEAPASPSLFDTPAPPQAPPVQEAPAAPSLFDTPAPPAQDPPSAPSLFDTPASPQAPPVHEAPAAPSLFDTPAPPPAPLAQETPAAPAPLETPDSPPAQPIHEAPIEQSLFDTPVSPTAPPAAPAEQPPQESSAGQQEASALLDQLTAAVTPQVDHAPAAEPPQEEPPAVAPGPATAAAPTARPPVTDPTTQGWVLSNPLPIPPRQVAPPEIRIMKDVAAAPSVANLISKLEQQAQKAAARLEEKLSEVQLRLQDDLAIKIKTVLNREEESTKTINSLKGVMTRKLKSAGDDLKGELTSGTKSGKELIGKFLDKARAGAMINRENLSKTTLERIDEVNSSSERRLSQTLQEMEKTQQEAMAHVRNVVQQAQEELASMQDEHKKVLQDQFDGSQSQIKDVWQNHHMEMQAFSQRLNSELEKYYTYKLSRLEAKCQEYLAALTQTAATSRVQIDLHSDALARELLLTRVGEARAGLLTLTQNLREQLKADLEQSAEFKFAELEPVLMRSRAELNLMLAEAEELKENVNRVQKAELEKIVTGAQEFMDEKIAEARGLAEFSLDELSALDKIIDELCDPSHIESDSELKEARAEIVARLKKIGAELHDTVNESLRVQIANMEDKSRSFQEDLISSMEGHAFGVRKSVETNLNKTREALKEAFAKIQATQDQYLS